VSPTGGAHIANDILEGINSLVQAAKAKARGYRTSRNLKPMIYLHPAAWPDLFHITRPVPHQLPSGSLETSMDGQALIRTAHRPNQVRSAKRLLNGHRARPDRRNRGNIAADEHVRSGRALVSCYCLDGGDAAANAQLHIDDHELRSPSRGGGNRAGLGRGREAFSSAGLSAPIFALLRPDTLKEGPRPVSQGSSLGEETRPRGELPGVPRTPAASAGPTIGCV